MLKRWAYILLPLLLAFSAAPACKKKALAPTPPPTATYTPSPDPSATHTPTGTITATETSTVTSTFTDTKTCTPTLTEIITATATETPTVTSTVTDTTTYTSTLTETMTSTATESPTVTSTFTDTKTCTPTITGTLPVMTPLTGEILFWEWESIGYRINKMNADCTGVTALTTGEFVDYGAKWNFNKTRILFIRGNLPELWVMDSDGGNAQQLIFDSFIVRGANWSPDGSKIVYSDKTSDSWNIYTINADGSGKTLVTQNGMYPDWGSNNRIVYSRDERDLYVMDPDGSNQTKLLEGVESNTSATWNSTASKIAFENWDSGSQYWRIGTIHSDGTGLMIITREFDYVDISFPVWSPDGQILLYSSEHHSYGPWTPELYGLFRMLSDGLFSVRIRPGKDSGTNIPRPTDWH